MQGHHAQVQDALQLEGQKLPNLTHPQSPVGCEDQAIELERIGRPPAFSFQPRDHLQLGQDLDLFDFDTAAEVAGASASDTAHDSCLPHPRPAAMLRQETCRQPDS